MAGGPSEPPDRRSVGTVGWGTTEGGVATTAADPAVPAAVRAYFEAVNARRWDDLAAQFTDDVELRVVGAEPRHGREDVAGYYPPLLAGFTSSFDDAHTFHVAADAVIVEIAFRGETVEGRTVAFDAVDLFRLRDGRIASVRILYDVLDVARQVRGGDRRTG